MCIYVHIHYLFVTLQYSCEATYDQTRKQHLTIAIHAVIVASISVEQEAWSPIHGTYNKANQRIEPRSTRSMCPDLISKPLL